MLTSISDRSYRAISLVFIIVAVDIDINFIAILRISSLSEVSATICATRILLLILNRNTPTHATFSDVPVLAASYDFRSAKVACFSLLVLFIVNALLVEFWVVGFSLCF